MPEDGVRIGIVGCGHWGSKWIRIFSSLGAHVKALCDVDKGTLKVAASKALEATLFRSHQSMIARGGVEAVYIATPPPTHFQIAKDCLTAGKHVLLEKPMTLRSKQGLKLISLAEENGCILMVGDTFIYNRAVQELKRLVDEGEIGSLRHIRCWMTNSIVDTGIGCPLTQRLDVLWDLGPHPVSITRYLAGESPSIVSVTGAPPLGSGSQPLHDVTIVNLRFPNEVLATIYLSWINHSRDRRITLLGESGILSCEDPSSRGSTRISLEKFSLEGSKLRSVNAEVWEVDVHDTLERECGHFLRCIREGAAPLSGGMEGVAVVRMLEAGHRSMRNGGACSPIR